MAGLVWLNIKYGKVARNRSDGEQLGISFFEEEVKMGILSHKGRIRVNLNMGFYKYRESFLENTSRALTNDGLKDICVQADSITFGRKRYSFFVKEHWSPYITRGRIEVTREGDDAIIEYYLFHPLVPLSALTMATFGIVMTLFVMPSRSYFMLFTMLIVSAVAFVGPIVIMKRAFPAFLGKIFEQVEKTTCNRP